MIGATRERTISAIRVDSIAIGGSAAARAAFGEIAPKITLCPTNKYHAKAARLSKIAKTPRVGPITPPSSKAPVNIMNLLQKQENGGTPVTAKSPIMNAAEASGTLLPRPLSSLILLEPVA